MAILPLLTEPDPRLHLISEEVDGVDEGIREILWNMKETMKAHHGIGLAAPQVNIHKRLVVMDVSYDDGYKKVESVTGPPHFEKELVLFLINPKIVWRSKERLRQQEGCLSVPDHYADVSRPAQVRVSYQDITGAHCENLFKNYQGACIQHEIDHLDGVLFVQRLSSLKQRLIRRKIEKRASPPPSSSA